MPNYIGAITAEESSHSVTPQPFQVPIPQESYCSSTDPNCTARSENLYTHVPENETESEGNFELLKF